MAIISSILFGSKSLIDCQNFLAFSTVFESSTVSKDNVDSFLSFTGFGDFEKEQTLMSMIVASLMIGSI